MYHLLIVINEYLLAIIKENRERISSGVVHSFTSTVEEMQSILDLDFYIGNEYSIVIEVYLMKLIKYFKRY